MMRDGVSVIVCCYNSSWIIKRCLEALILQKVDDRLKWEIIVVNNASTDNTKQIAVEILKDSGVAHQIVEEFEPGLLNARKKGISIAHYKYTIYCDDDNLLYNSYIQNAYEIINGQPDLGAIGGKGIAEFQSVPDPLVLKNIHSYAVGNQHKHASEYVWGAGCCLRTDIVKAIYSKQKMHLSGRKGKDLLAGDDAELVMSIRLNGYKSACDDCLEYTHVLPDNRLTLSYLTKMYQGFAMAWPIVSVYRIVLRRLPFIFVYIYYCKCLCKLSIVQSVCDSV